MSDEILFVCLVPPKEDIVESGSGCRNKLSGHRHIAEMGELENVEFMKRAVWS